jgi:hypothetical protein
MLQRSVFPDFFSVILKESRVKFLITWRAAFFYSKKLLVGSGSGSGFGSFYHQTKIVRKNLIPSVFLLLFTFLSLKNDVDVPQKSNK